MKKRGKALLLFILLFWNAQARAQTSDDSFVGDWKCYLADSTSFEFLRLNADGTGVKCFGQTIDNRDTLFLDHITALFITSWTVKEGSLIINSTNKVRFKVNSQYRYSWVNDDRLVLKGEHLLLDIYPSVLTRAQFRRSVSYQRASKLAGGYGVKVAGCIVMDTTLFSFRPLDSTFQVAEYKGFKDLIPHIFGCGAPFQFVQRYPDPPYSLMIPRWIHRWSFGFGDKKFTISLNSDEKDETTIEIYYDFRNEMKDFYFEEILQGKEKKDIVMRNNRSIYKTVSWQGKYEGQIFLDHSMIIMYFTKDKSLQEDLQKCIASFQYIN